MYNWRLAVMQAWHSFTHVTEYPQDFTFSETGQDAIIHLCNHWTYVRNQTAKRLSMQSDFYEYTAICTWSNISNVCNQFFIIHKIWQQEMMLNITLWRVRWYNMDLHHYHYHLDIWVTTDISSSISSAHVSKNQKKGRRASNFGVSVNYIFRISKNPLTTFSKHIVHFCLTILIWYLWLSQMLLHREPISDY